MIKKGYITLVFSILLLFLGTLLINIKNNTLTNEAFIPAGILSVIFIVVQIISVKLRKNADNYLLSLVMFMSSISAIMILRLKPDLYMHQIVWICIGPIVFFLILTVSGRLF